MPPQLDWMELKCDSCNSPRFVQVFHLRYKRDGGTTPQPCGWMCKECGALVDTGRLIRMAELQQKRQQAKELEAELAAEAPPKEAASAPGTGR